MGLDQDRLLRLLLVHRAMLIGYIHSIVRDSNLAEDIFQDVSLVVLRKGDAIEDEALFPVWARKAARFEALNALRKQKRGPCVLDDEVLESLESHWTEADATEPHQAVDALRHCMEKLTPRAKELVELRYRDNLSGQRLADSLAKPLNTVYVALSRAHRALAECIKRRLSGEGAMYA